MTRAALAVVLCLAVVLAGVTFGAESTRSTLTDVEVVRVTLGADEDLTGDATVLGVDPDPLVVTDGRPSSNFVTIRLAVQESSAVDTDRFTLSAGGQTVDADRVRVERDGTVSVTVRAADLLALVGDGPGTTDVEVRGWWAFDRSFVATAVVTVTEESRGGGPQDQSVDSSSTTTTATTTTTASNTTTTTTSPSATTESTTTATTTESTTTATTTESTTTTQTTQSTTTATTQTTTATTTAQSP